MPPRWSFYLPDFDFDVRDFDSHDVDPTTPDEEKPEIADFKSEIIDSKADDIDVSSDSGSYLKAFRVDFDAADKRDPKNWSVAYRILVIGMFAYTTLATGIYSTAYSSGIPQMVSELGVVNASLPLLGISLYLVGLALGALIMAPLSETFGRRPMYAVGLAAFLALIPVAGLATNFETVIVARFLG